MNERLLRTFISVTLPNEIVGLSNMLKTTVKPAKDNVKWVNFGNIHLTLKFLGQTPDKATDEINNALKEVVATHKNMELKINGTGCFPTVERPRVLWLGVDGDIGPLKNFVSEIDNKLEILGFPIDSKEYIPHITLARIKYPPKETPDISDFLNTSFEPLKFNINRIRFMSSELFPNGPIYSILGTHFLGENPK